MPVPVSAPAPAVTDAEERLQEELTRFQAREGKKVWFTASRSGSTAVEEVEGERPLADYMRLPVSQYSVLDGARIDRLAEDTFELSMDVLQFFNFSLRPILTAQVVTHDRGCEINVLSVRIEGPKIIEAANGTYFIDSQNRVSWVAPDEDGGDEAGRDKKITSDAYVKVGVVVPGWNVLPLGLIERTGSALMRGTLRVILPRFLKQLASDYRNWAAGDDSRGAVQVEDDDDDFI